MELLIDSWRISAAKGQTGDFAARQGLQGTRQELLDFARQDRRRRLDELRGFAHGGINHRGAAASLSRRGNRDLVHASAFDHAAKPLTILAPEELRDGDHPRDQMARGARELLAFPADRPKDLPGAVDLPPLPAVEDECLLQCRVQTHGKQLNCPLRNRGVRRTRRGSRGARSPGGEFAVRSLPPPPLPPVESPDRLAHAERDHAVPGASGGPRARNRAHTSAGGRPAAILRVTTRRRQVSSGSSSSVQKSRQSRASFQLCSGRRR